MSKTISTMLAVVVALQIGDQAVAAVPVQDSTVHTTCNELFSVYRTNIHVAIRMAGIAPQAKEPPSLPTKAGLSRPI